MKVIPVLKCNGENQFSMLVLVRKLKLKPHALTPREYIRSCSLEQQLPKSDHRCFLAVVIGICVACMLVLYIFIQEHQCSGVIIYRVQIH